MEAFFEFLQSIQISEAIVGVIVGGLITYLVTCRQLAHAKEVQEMNLRAEDRRRREELWFETMTGPFLSHRRSCVERVVEILVGLERIEPEGELMEELHRLLPYLPPQVQEMLEVWSDQRREALDSNDDPYAPRFREGRYHIAAAATAQLVRAVSPDTLQQFVEDGQVAWVDEYIWPEEWVESESPDETDPGEETCPESASQDS